MDEQFKRLVVVFGMPNKPDPKAYLDEFTSAVGTVWPDGVLQRAVSRLISEHDDPFWPAPAKLRAMCREECPKPKLANDSIDERPQLSDEQIAEQERALREFKERMASMKLDDDDEQTSLPDVSRDTFERMLLNSPNAFHRRQS